MASFLGLRVPADCTLTMPDPARARFIVQAGPNPEARREFSFRDFDWQGNVMVLGDEGATWCRQALAYQYGLATYPLETK